MQAPEYERLRAMEDHHWWYAILRGLVEAELLRRLPPRANVLDAGCGTGGMMSLLNQRHPQWATQGIDANATAIAHCHARGLQVQQGDVADLPYPVDRFDAVLSLDVLYHSAVDQERALEEMVRVLKPGGLLILNLPAFECLRGTHDVAVCGARRYKACHVREMLENRNLINAMTHYWNAWLFLPLLVRRWWSRSASSPASDLSLSPQWLNALLTTVGRMDARFCRALQVPWGSSVFAVAVKPQTGGAK